MVWTARRIIDNTPKLKSIPIYILNSLNSGENAMKTIINEDWLATILAFVLLILAILNVIQPAWMVF